MIPLDNSFLCLQPWFVIHERIFSHDDCWPQRETISEKLFIGKCILFFSPFVSNIAVPVTLATFLVWTIVIDTRMSSRRLLCFFFSAEETILISLCAFLVIHISSIPIMNHLTKIIAWFFAKSNILTLQSGKDFVVNFIPEVLLADVDIYLVTRCGLDLLQWLFQNSWYLVLW